MRGRRREVMRMMTERKEGEMYVVRMDRNKGEEAGREVVRIERKEG